MDDSAEPSAETQFELDDAKLNAVQRRLVRPHLFYVLAGTLMFLVFSGALVFEAARSWVAAYADGTDDFAPVAASAVAAFLLYFLWKNASALGAVLAHVRRPDTAICKGQVDGVSLGPCTARLSADAIGWQNRDYRYALHLSGIHSARHHGQILLMRNNLPEARFVFGPDMKDWADAINARRRTLDRAGWPLPEGDGWRRYSLTRHDYQGGLSGLELQSTPPGMLIVTAISVLFMLAVAVFGVIGLTSDPVGWRNAMALLFLVPATMIVCREARWLTVGYRRHRAGLSPYGRDVEDVTHGETAFRIGDEGIEIHRALLRKTIRWEAVASVEQKGAWLSLRAADITLDILPSSSEVVDALNRAGFDVPCGPWERAAGAHTFKRAA